MRTLEAAPLDERTTDPPPTRRWWVLATTCVALMLIVIDNTILNVALPTIQRDLEASASELQWTVDSYVLVFAGLLLLAGAIGDRFGRRRALIGGLVVFAVGSALAMVADSAGQLIATRALMGVGGAFIMPATLSILIDVFQDHRERAKAIGVWSAVAGLGVVLGPVVGGWLVEHASWQAAFGINLPLVAVTVVAAIVVVPDSRNATPPRLDLVGATLSVLALGITLYGIIEAPHRGWTSTTTLTTVAVGLLVALAFIAWESHVDEPMLPLQFFRNRHFASGSAAISVTFFGLFAAMFLATQYLQAVQGYSGFEAGLRTLPIGIIVVVAPISAAVAQRVGAGRVVTTGMAVIATGMAVSSTFEVDSAYFPHVGGAFLLVGIGMGMIVAPATEAIMGSVPVSQAGVGSAVNDTVREVGGAFGVAVIGSVAASTYTSGIDQSGVTAGLPAEAVGHVRDGIGGALATAPQLPDPVGGQVTDAARQAFTDAASQGFLVAAVVVAIGAVLLGWALRRADRTGHPLDDQPMIDSAVAGEAGR